MKKIERDISYVFSDKELPLRALTHSSYANERKINITECNERLEFLGDAVLELITSTLIYKKYPDMPEGRMSRLRAALVCESALARAASGIGLKDEILLGKGERASGGSMKPSVISDAFEALIGAIYLDGGYEAAARFVEEFVLCDTDRFLNENDPKSALQEYLQTEGAVSIEYTVTDISGPDHDRVHEVEVSVNGKVCGKGKGRKKKDAEKAAAAAALENLRSGRQ
ncbi:MAG: ribonuclease III [Lachnospiraceae bacterium]|nr:ribonuclease III [Lachnospiraceae bacterium]